MGQLTGKRTKTTIEEIEVVSIDQRHVLKISRQSNGDVKFYTRDANESSWSASPIHSFEVEKEDTRLVAAVISGDDAQYMHKLEKITTSGFQLPQPIREPSGTDADCTPLDVERARAQNITEERELVKDQLRLDHSRDKHVGALITGCPSCEDRIRPGHGDGSLPEPDPWAISPAGTIRGDDLSLIDETEDTDKPY